MVLDSVWVLAKLKPVPSVIYVMGTSAKEVWEKVDEMGITTWDRTYLRKQGYRAMKIQLTLPDDPQRGLGQV